MGSIVEFLKRLVQIVFLLAALVVMGAVVFGVGALVAEFRSPAEPAEKPSILALDLDGIIVDTRDIVEALRKYRKDNHIKGVLLRIDSPGGVVGPSQELWAEIKRTREQYKKPVIAFCGAVAASGAYYAAVAADRIVTTPGCMIGSIGALMEFVNLAKLYDWARIDRYAITTGQFKDAGADYKPLTDTQRALFQDLLNDVLAQFKAAVAEGRKMAPEVVDQYADGRVFTGAQAVKLGFADSVGTWDDARRALGQMTGLGDEPEVFKVRKPGRLARWLGEEATSPAASVSAALRDVLQTELSARPLLLLPGAVRF
ncbi:protease-4 [Roseiarcus fermentans]|uniref:Protease-4 n=1 Tax=Roseiarcus fermentans TaxID=1473586 RepID=A0A366FGR3_9HYPH|nr:signal peptide peptidase SppA [Roseiarcus fermentans]RBP13863.1 protease-4 [Roseiarcus fermentans]